MTRIEELLLRWQEEALQAEELAELEQLLQSAAGRRQLVEEFYYNETLGSALRSASSPPMPTVRRLPRRRMWAGLAAAALLAATAVWWRSIAPGPPAPERAEPHNQVIAGQVSLEGKVARAVPDGAAIRVLQADAAVIRLADGSRAELEPGTEAVLHGPVPGLRQMIELVEGGGSFQVEKQDGPFQVETRLGRVTALGTEFQVRILPSNQLAVRVREGLVEVDQGGRTQLLTAGQHRVFSRAANRSRESRGVLAGLDARTITISKRGDGTTVTHPLAGQVKAFIDGKPALLAELAPGAIVYLEHSPEQGGVFAIRAEGPSTGGEVLALDPAARTLTLLGRGERRVVLAADVQVSLDGQPAALADVRPGCYVVLRLAADRQKVVRIAVSSSDPRERR